MSAGGRGTRQGKGAYLNQNERDDLQRQVNNLSDLVRQICPIGASILANLTAAQIAKWFSSTGLGLPGQPWFGWAIENGNNGTPNSDGRFVRMNVTAAGATGGSDTAAHTHTYGTLIASIDPMAGGDTFKARRSASSYTYNVSGTLVGAGASGTATNGVTIYGDTGGASSTNNMPKYYEKVPLMRVA